MNLLIPDTTGIESSAQLNTHEKNPVFILCSKKPIKIFEFKIMYYI